MTFRRGIGRRDDLILLKEEALVDDMKVMYFSRLKPLSGSNINFYRKIVDFIYSQISMHQYGFIKGKSTAPKLLTTISHIVDSMDAKHSLDAIFLDVRKDGTIIQTSVHWLCW